MDDQPTPSSFHGLGENESDRIFDTPPAPHAKHVQFRRTPRPRPSLSRDKPTLHQASADDKSSFHQANGSAMGDGRRASKSIDLLKREDAYGSMNEQSPLLAPTRRSQDVGLLEPLDDVRSPDSGETAWNDQEEYFQETKSSWYLLLLTLAIAGLQIAWSVELSNGSPYLLSLGISKSLLAFVWIAGPLSGTLVQPYVGIKSDRCRSRFGKRRPFMVGGAIATILSLMALAWTREIIGGIGSLFGIERTSQSTVTTSIVFAILMIYVLDFSINVIQAAVRAFIVDNAPSHQQDAANAWASRMSGVGNIVGYLFGYVNLPKYLWFFGDTQFKVLCVIASLAMGATLAVSCSTIHERDPRLEGEPGKQQGGVLAFFRDLFRSMRKLPRQIQSVCFVQFFAWIGWFPFLFYITTYIGEIYTEPIYEANPDLSETEVNRVWEQGTRIGTFALLVFAVTTFASSVILPFIVASSYQGPAAGEVPSVTPMTPGAIGPTAPLTPRTPGGGILGAQTPRTPHTPGGGVVGDGGYFGYNPAAHTDTDSVQLPGKTRKSFFRRVLGIRSLQIKWLTLRRAWMLSLVFFCLLCWATFVVRDVSAATVLVGLIGIPWAMTNWAPFALIAAEISKRDAIRRGAIPPPPTHDGELLARGEDEAEGADQAGVVLGIHNVAIAAPQVIATLVSSVLFKLLQKPRGVPGDTSVAWVLRFGGVAALAAAWMTRRVSEETDD